MSQKKDGIPQVSTETRDYLVSTKNFENGNVPIYWGPNQETSLGYVNPSEFKRQVLVCVPEVVRFIYQGLDFTPSGADCTTCVIGVSGGFENGFAADLDFAFWSIGYTLRTTCPGEDPVDTEVTECHIITTDPDRCGISDCENCEFMASVGDDILGALEEEFLARMDELADQAC